MPSKRRLLGALGLLLIVGAVSVWSSGPPRDADALLGAMQVETGDWVADVGSGEGEYTLQMAQAVGDSGRAVAVDIDEDHLEELNDEIKDRGIENITTISSVYDNPMLPHRSFDAILVRNAYHEFTAHEAMLRHLYAALKPGGRLVVAEYIGDDLVDEDRAAQVDNHELAMRYARQELRQAGFEIADEVDAFKQSGVLLAMRYGRRELKRTGAETFSSPDALMEGIEGYRMWMIVALRPSRDRDS